MMPPPPLNPACRVASWICPSEPSLLSSIGALAVAEGGGIGAALGGSSGVGAGLVAEGGGMGAALAGLFAALNGDGDHVGAGRFGAGRLGEGVTVPALIRRSLFHRPRMRLDCPAFCKFIGSRTGAGRSGSLLMRLAAAATFNAVRSLATPAPVGVAAEAGTREPEAGSRSKPRFDAHWSAGGLVTFGFSVGGEADACASLAASSTASTSGPGSPRRAPDAACGTRHSASAGAFACGSVVAPPAPDVLVTAGT